VGDATTPVHRSGSSTEHKKLSCPRPNNPQQRLVALTYNMKPGEKDRERIEEGAPSKRISSPWHHQKAMDMLKKKVCVSGYPETGRHQKLSCGISRYPDNLNHGCAMQFLKSAWQLFVSSHQARYRTIEKKKKKKKGKKGPDPRPSFYTCPGLVCARWQFFKSGSRVRGYLVPASLLWGGRHPGGRSEMRWGTRQVRAGPARWLDARDGEGGVVA